MCIELYGNPFISTLVRKGKIIHVVKHLYPSTGWHWAVSVFGYYEQSCSEYLYVCRYMLSFLLDRPGSGIARLCDNYMFKILKTAKLFSKAALLNCVLTCNAWGFQLILSGVFSNTTVQKYQFFSTQLSLQSNSHIHAWLLEKS